MSTHGTILDLFRVSSVIRRCHGMTMASPYALLTRKIPQNISHSAN